MRPCRSINKVTIDYLNNLEKYDNAYLDSFQGHGPVYGHLQLKDLDFLSEHCCKQVFSLFFSFQIQEFTIICLYVICLLIGFVWFIFPVAGDSLKRVLDRGVREKMDKAMMFLV